MKVEFINNLKKNQMTVVVSLQKRKKASEPRIRFKWKDVEKYVLENYTPPKTHFLGDCHDKIRFADNDSDRLCVMQWVFDLFSNKKQANKAPKTKTVREK